MSLTEFYNKGRHIEIDKINDRYCVTVDGRMTQQDLTPDEIVRWFSHAMCDSLGPE